MHTLVLAAALAAAPGAGGWVAHGQAEGVTTFLREPRPAKGIAFRGEGLVEAPLAKVVTALTDVPRIAQWLPDTAELTVLKVLPNGDRIIRDRASMPFPFQDRDYLVTAHIDVGAKGQTVTITETSVDDPAFAPASGDVRGQVERSLYALESRDGGRTTFVTMELVADPSGDLPIWLVDAFASDSPRKTILALRREVARTELQPSAEIEALLAKAR